MNTTFRDGIVLPGIELDGAAPRRDLLLRSSVFGIGRVARLEMTLYLVLIVCNHRRAFGGNTLYQIWIIGAIALLAGLSGGWAGYLLDPISSGVDGPSKTHARKRYLVLGVIAAVCVPLFLSVLQSDLIDNIFTPDKENGREVVPFTQFLIFAGFCLIAAISARNFLDSISKQVMRDAQRANETATEARAEAKEAGEKAEVASELAEEAFEKDKGGSQAAIATTASEIPPGEAIPEVSPQEHKALQAMMKMSLRTATGVANEVGIPRTQVGELLDYLASKKLVQRTTSPSTGGPRWQITSLGIHALNAADKG